MNKKRLLIIIGIVVAAVVVAILLDTMLANHRPAIISLNAEPNRVVPSGTCQIVCNATDSDGEELTYAWSAEGGAISGEGATVNWTAPGAAGSYNITVIVLDGHGGEATATETVTVRRNSAPTINTVVASSAWTLPSDSLNVTCDASDTDGDELSYEWTASAGNVSGTGTDISWTAPQEVGIYNIMVMVTDAHGWSDTWTLPVSVVTGQPPTVDQLLVTAEHCYLKAYSWGYKVGKEQEYHIECIVADNSSVLSYDWSCDGGEISGQGSMITWTAPNPPGTTDVTLTVIVSNIDGNMAIEDVMLNVVSCSRCTFGC